MSQFTTLGMTQYGGQCGCISCLEGSAVGQFSIVVALL